MLKFVILLSVIACVFGAALPEGMLSQTDGRIVGGVDTTISSFPWQVSLQHNGYHICGGSIYNANIIITAAHCLQNVSPADIKVRAGSSFWNTGGVLVNVAAFRKHEGYNPKTMANDIAVIYLSSALTLSSDIKPISLATKAPADGAAASVSGWGTTNYGSNSIPDQLQYIDVNVIGTKQCRSSSYQYGREIKPSMICAYAVGKDACQMDSGSPLLSGGLLVGVVSWGYGCGQNDYPAVYADIAELGFWIKLAADSY